MHNYYWPMLNRPIYWPIFNIQFIPFCQKQKQKTKEIIMATLATLYRALYTLYDLKVNVLVRNSETE